ncbi:MAG: hypothetical protein JO022_08290 [Acidobacteriaceae bacterium]|nr:hypothetical protein [Acidobacteriaceae bacterium]
MNPKFQSNRSRRDLLAALAFFGAQNVGAVAYPVREPQGAAILMTVNQRHILSIRNSETARRALLPPGSTLKPLSLLALIEAGKLGPGDEYLCRQELTIEGHRLTCSHPAGLPPMNITRAIAYSCNCAVAYFAQRFAPGELANTLARAGLCGPTGFLSEAEAAGEVRSDVTGPRAQLQALGEAGVELTPLELLAAYRQLARTVSQAHMVPIIDGLEGAVEYGTAQQARLSRIRVAGKTGTTLTSTGAHAAWFAGFAPSRAPEVAIVVLVQGRSGGADAAPVAGTLLREYFGARN